MVMLLNEKALRERCNKQYDDMRKRARPRLWKSGRRKGHVRVPGIEQLPFTKDQLWKLALEQVGTGLKLCPYCEEIGKPATPIDLRSFVWDHIEPISRIGIAAHRLQNLKAVCADCNNIKGHLSYDFFIGLMRAIEDWTDAEDRKNIVLCLRTHGVTMRLRYPGNNEPQAAAEQETIPSTMPLALKEDW
jgi:5-methylcytosine-specific restriction endonuclease McrA